MKALVVYESMYGNTAAIGEAVAASLQAKGLEVDARHLSKVAPAEAVGFDLLVVGGPTHAHGMTRAGTRKTAVEDEKNTYADAVINPGLREWMDQLSDGGGRLSAAFDTRIDKPAFITGSAAKGIGRRLGKHGYRVVVAPESFLVSTKNELIDGESDRATTWGAVVADQAEAPASTS